MTDKIVITNIDHDEERIAVKINGKTIASFNHDEHGWSGMEAVERVVEQMAKALKMEFARK